jgi:hypothetical protein
MRLEKSSLVHGRRIVATTALHYESTGGIGAESDGDVIGEFIEGPTHPISDVTFSDTRPAVFFTDETTAHA